MISVRGSMNKTAINVKLLEIIFHISIHLRTNTYCHSVRHVTLVVWRHKDLMKVNKIHLSPPNPWSYYKNIFLSQFNNLSLFVEVSSKLMAVRAFSILSIVACFAGILTSLMFIRGQMNGLVPGLIYLGSGMYMDTLLFDFQLPILNLCWTQNQTCK